MTYVSPAKAFEHMDRLAAWRAGDKPAPVTVEWDLSNRCSLGCQYCHFAHTHTRGPWAGRDRALPVMYDQPGDLADTELVKRSLTDMAAFGVKAIVWSGGGEPTLHPDWRDIMLHARSVGLSQGMYTLGGHLSDADAAVLGECATWVVVSLDADTADAYAAEKSVPPPRFYEACNGVRRLSQHDVVVGVSFLMHADNYRRALPMLWLARSLGATYTMFRPTIETSPDDPAKCLSDREWVNDALPIMERLAHEDDVEVEPDRFLAYRDWTGRSYKTCYGIRLNATITPDGRVWVCPQRRGVDGSCVGDLREKTFADLWKNHVGQWTDFHDCRVMCRLHLLNEQLDAAYATHRHAEFV